MHPDNIVPGKLVMVVRWLIDDPPDYGVPSIDAAAPLVGEPLLVEEAYLSPLLFPQTASSLQTVIVRRLLDVPPADEFVAFRLGHLELRQITEGDVRVIVRNKERLRKVWEIREDLVAEWEGR